MHMHMKIINELQCLASSVHQNTIYCRKRPKKFAAELENQVEPVLVCCQSYFHHRVLLLPHASTPFPSTYDPTIPGVNFFQQQKKKCSTKRFRPYKLWVVVLEKEVSSVPNATAHRKLAKMEE